MKAAFEEAAADMGGRAEVEIEVMYPGFKYQDGDQVVEIAKKAAAKIGRPSEPANERRRKRRERNRWSWHPDGQSCCRL